MGFTEPYAYFGYAAAVVRAGDTRFSRVEDFNRSDITLAVTQGVTDQEFVAQHLPQANVKLIPGPEISITLTEVLTGKADAALADVPTLIDFLHAHTAEVRCLFLDNPPARTPAAFMTRQDEIRFISFLNNAFRFLEANGIFEELDKKYSLPSFRITKTWKPGSGVPK